MGEEPSDIKTFRVEVPESDLDELRRRLQATRWPNEAPTGAPDEAPTDALTGPPTDSSADPPADPWEQGTPLRYLQDLVGYWADGYDWRKAEARLNSYPQFTTVVGGQRIHFMHVPSPHPGALPLVLSHGWPGSVVEFLDCIGPLIDPPDGEDAFSLVIPSLPGYGFSGPTSDRGWTPRRIGAAFATVMERLGYERYGVQGGDWGSVVSANMADLHPERVVGLHVNFLNLPAPEGAAVHPPAVRFARTGSGYQQIQGTKPQTIGYLLEDSPAGLAGWIVEKFREWSDCGGDPERSFTKDQLLTNVMVYWVTRTATSAARLYWEMRRAGRTTLPQQPVRVPTGVANFPAEIARTERAWAERRYNVVHWTEHPRGGHFAAMEVPDLFVEDVRTFFRPLR